MGGLPGTIASALAEATRAFIECISKGPNIYPNINRIQVSIKSDKDA